MPEGPVSPNEEWPDRRIDDLASMVRTFAPVAGQVAGIEATLDAMGRSMQRLEESIQSLDDECSSRDHRVHERIDQLARDTNTALVDLTKQVRDQIADQNREYRRNIMVVLGAFTLMALAVAAKVLFVIELPTP